MKVGDLVKVRWYEYGDGVEDGFGVLVKDLSEYNVEPRWQVLYESELWNISYRNLEIIR